MKVNRFLVVALATALSVVNTACNRGTDTPDTIDAKEQQHATDSDRIKSESDQVTSDADAVLNSTSLGRTAGTLGASLCGASVDSSQMAQKIITVTYDGTTNCNGYVRSGIVVLKLVSGAKWRDAGAVLEITHTNYKVTRQTDNKSITFNGVKYVTNVQGFNWQTLTREFKERGNNLTITFDDGSQRVWSLARHWNITINSLNPLKITYTITGDSTVNGISNAMAWGTNRNGVTFTNSTPVAIQTVYGGSCPARNPLAGKWVHTLDGKGTLTVTLGVDNQGNPVTGTCPYGYKMEWAATNGNSATVIKQYP